MFQIEYVDDLKFIDWVAIIFRRKKICPKCNIETFRNTKTSTIKDDFGFYKSGSMKFTFGKRIKKFKEIRYECKECNQRFKPSIFW